MVTSPTEDLMVAPRARRGLWRRRILGGDSHWSQYLTRPVAWGVAAFNILVLSWIVLSSLKSTREIFLDPWGLPKKLMFENYYQAWEVGSFGEGAISSVILVVFTGIGVLLLAAPAAYALARFHAPFEGTHTMILVLGLAVPVQTIVIPIYVGFDNLRLLDSLWGLVLIHIGTGIPFAVFLLSAFFRSLPAELEEAAAIDGASVTFTFWRIMLPMARSGMITVFILQAIGTWGEIFFALIMLQSKTTISLSVLTFSQSLQYTGAQYSVLFAGIVIVIAPLLLMYILLGRRIVEGLSAGYGK